MIIINELRHVVVSTKLINPSFEIHFFKVGAAKRATSHIQNILKMLMIFTSIFMVENGFQSWFYQTIIDLNVFILKYIVKPNVTIILDQLIHVRKFIWRPSGIIFCKWMKFAKNVVFIIRFNLTDFLNSHRGEFISGKSHRNPIQIFSYHTQEW